MPAILALDTTGESLTAVLFKDGEIFPYSLSTGKKGHSGALIGAIDDVLKKGGVDVSQLDAVAVNVGPGSFTGIRIGVSAATAVAYATGAKRIAVTSFELLAYNRSKLTAAVEAGHGNLFVADCDNGRVSNARFVEAADAAAFTDAVREPACERAEALAAVAAERFAKGEFSAVFEPYYMRKSQAERNGDEA